MNLRIFKWADDAVKMIISVCYILLRLIKNFTIYKGDNLRKLSASSPLQVAKWLKKRILILIVIITQFKIYKIHQYSLELFEIIDISQKILNIYRLSIIYSRVFMGKSKNREVVGNLDTVSMIPISY